MNSGGPDLFLQHNVDTWGGSEKRTVEKTRERVEATINLRKI